jgi:hypothetical protein
MADRSGVKVLREETVAPAGYFAAEIRKGRASPTKNATASRKRKLRRQSRGRAQADSATEALGLLGRP